MLTFLASDRIAPVPAFAVAIVSCLLAAACGRGAISGGATREGSQALASQSLWTRQAGVSATFSDPWFDGRAELSGYRIKTPRYGQAREGELVLIYVTEPHDRRSWLKVDANEVPSREQVTVMKLNVSLKFMTGVYPYSVLTSVFSPVDDFGGHRFRPARITMGAQEWCGHVYQALVPSDDEFRYQIASYFDSEGEQNAEVPTASEALYEDALLIQLRELDGVFNGGEDYEGSLVPSLWRARVAHTPLRPRSATIRRSEAEYNGTPVTRFVVQSEGYERTFDVEKASPRRVLRWTTNEGEEAVLLDTARLKYWGLNGLGDEVHRAKLGLDSKTPQAPPFQDEPSVEVETSP